MGRFSSLDCLQRASQGEHSVIMLDIEAAELGNISEQHAAGFVGALVIQ